MWQDKQCLIYTAFNKIFKHCISHISDGKISISYKKNNPFSLEFDQALSDIQLITLIMLPEITGLDIDKIMK